MVASPAIASRRDNPGVFVKEKRVDRARPRYDPRVTGQRDYGPRDREPDAERSSYRCEDMGRQQGKDHAYHWDGAKRPTTDGEDSCVQRACSKRNAG